ncbi:hypothetical protein AB6A40_009296 [Gnathostoma spinigerum]|uniref:Uncharacterized protein n=1 Tax=Gnathostoma spinigerum TaxID=75299 RepID=A0ABD6EU00_9BILA
MFLAPTLHPPSTNPSTDIYLCTYVSEGLNDVRPFPKWLISGHSWDVRTSLNVDVAIRTDVQSREIVLQIHSSLESSSEICLFICFPKLRLVNRG